MAKSESKKMHRTIIEGLFWQPSVCTGSQRSYTHVLPSVGVGSPDLLFYGDDGNEAWFGLHVGQTDRLTFLGNPQQHIRASFIDCRKGSKTLHRRVDLQFCPDPTQQLVIDRGIAHAFSNTRHITVRVENTWFMANNNPDYDIANDSINFRGDDSPNDFPVVAVNDLPLPPEVQQYVIASQQRAIEAGTYNNFTNRVVIAGQSRKVLINSKS